MVAMMSMNAACFGEETNHVVSHKVPPGRGRREAEAECAGRQTRRVSAHFCTADSGESWGGSDGQRALLFRIKQLRKRV